MKALIIIDIQNDYFEQGKFPLWNTEQTLSNIKLAIEKFKGKNIPIILVKHVADSKNGIAPFFNEGTSGVEIHSEISSITPNCEIVIKSFADSFYNTNLNEVLKRQNIDEIFLCGMMTQNCVTHTAISKEAEKYKVTIISDCCTTVSEPIHLIALNAVSTRVNLKNINEIVF